MTLTGVANYCDRKRKFGSKKLADAIMKHIKIENIFRGDLTPLHTYNCPNCYAYHIGHNKYE